MSVSVKTNFYKMSSVKTITSIYIFKKVIQRIQATIQFATLHSLTQPNFVAKIVAIHFYKSRVRVPST